MRYSIVAIAALLMFSGCVGMQKPAPEPKPVVKKVEKPKPKPKRKSVVRHKKPKKGKVPPLPKREVDVDLDSMVDQAADAVLSNEGTATE